MKIDPVIVKLEEDSWDRRHWGWSTPTGNLRKLRWSATDWHLLRIYALSYGLRWQRTARWLTSQCRLTVEVVRRLRIASYGDWCRIYLLACKSFLDWH